MLFPVLQKFDLLSDRRRSVIDELGVGHKIDRKVGRDPSELLGMTFQLICVSAEYFDDRFQMFFHVGYSKETTAAAGYARLGGGMHWFGVASVPLMALFSTFIQATRAGSTAG